MSFVDADSSLSNIKHTHLHRDSSVFDGLFIAYMLFFKAKAANITVVEVDEIVDVGQIDPERVDVSGVY